VVTVVLILLTSVDEDSLTSTDFGGRIFFVAVSLICLKKVAAILLRNSWYASLSKIDLSPSSSLFSLSDSLAIFLFWSFMVPASLRCEARLSPLLQILSNVNICSNYHVKSPKYWHVQYLVENNSGKSGAPQHELSYYLGKYFILFTPPFSLFVIQKFNISFNNNLFQSYRSNSGLWFDPPIT